MARWITSEAAHAAAFIVGLGVVWMTLASTAQAQTVSPMEAHVKAVSGQAVAQFTVANPYDLAQTSDFYVVSDQGEPIAGARVLPFRQQLGPRARSRLTVSVPMEGLTRRKVYVCHSIEPRYAGQVGGGASFRGEVCAKLVAEAVR